MSRTLCIGFLCLPFPLLAHGGGGGTGLLAGLSHPVFGTDHLLAMLCTGLLAARLTAKQRALPPALFLLGMLAGGALGLVGTELPVLEFVIMLSVLTLGGGLLPRTSLPALTLILLAGGFGFFHGNAHGLEMPESGGAGAYVAGFLISTTSLLTSGLLGGLLLGSHSRGQLALRLTGLAISLYGFWLLIG